MCQDKIARLRLNFIAGLPQRATEAQTLFKSIQTNDKDAVVSLHRLFHKIKGVANTFGLCDLGVLAAEGEERASHLLNSTPDGEEAFWQEVFEFMSRFEDCIQTIQKDNQNVNAAEETAAVNESSHIRAAAPVRLGERSPVSVLVVDDDSTMRGVLKALLRSDDYIVLGDASNGVDALAKCNSLKPDLVLLDINMPGVDGLQVLAEIKKALPKVTVIMVSGNAAVEKVCEAVGMGAAGFIVKPFNAATVLDRIAQCLKVKK